MKCLAVLFALAWMLALATQPAVAQSCYEKPPQPRDCWITITVQQGQLSATWPPKGAILYCPDGVPEGFATLFLRNTQCPAAPQCPTCNTGGAPIDFATGDTYITQNDIRIPGLGGGLTLTRTWNSISFEGVAQVGMFGLRWTSNLEESIFVGSDGLIKYLRGDGGIWSFAYSGGSTNGSAYAVVGPANKTATMTQTATNWTIAFENGEQRVFDLTSGKLLSIADRNGNTTQLSYDTSNRLTTVTDAVSRHVYFSYATPSSLLVTSVSSDFGVALSYSYDAFGRLVNVTKPDSTTVSFQYDSNFFISAVLDTNGKILESHTYDSQGRGLTSSRVGGVEAVTITYPPTQ